MLPVLVARASRRPPEDDDGLAHPIELGAVVAGFSRDMQTHHNQAVELSLIVRDRTRT